MKTLQSVLIADESNVTQHILATTYIKAGYLIRTASTANELKNVLRMEPVSLVLLSIGFCANPFEMIEYIRKSSPGSKIVLMATSLSIQETVEFVKVGVSDCVVKPFQAEALLKKTQQMFEAEKQKSGFDNLDSSLTEKMDGTSAKTNIVKPEDEPNVLIQAIDKTVNSIRDFRINVLVTGETGCGKSFYAHRLHSGAATGNEPFISFNCESIQREEMEQVLFGADRQSGGLLPQVKNGTFYIQALDHMPLELQSRLVNILQDTGYKFAADAGKPAFHGRVIASMTISPEQGIATEKIRKDLYYLLNEARLDLPPLRVCKDRIPHLAYAIMQSLSQETGIAVPHVSDNYWNIISNYEWPGNIRELNNVVKYSFLIAQGKEITSSMLPMGVTQASRKRMTEANGDDYFDLRDYLKEQEKEIILQTLEKFNGNRIQTARYLRISERALRYKINEFNES